MVRGINHHTSFASYFQKTACLRVKFLPRLSTGTSRAVDIRASAAWDPAVSKLNGSDTLCCRMFETPRHHTCKGLVKKWTRGTRCNVIVKSFCGPFRRHQCWLLNTAEPMTVTCQLLAGQAFHPSSGRVEPLTKTTTHTHGLKRNSLKLQLSLTQDLRREGEWCAHVPGTMRNSKVTQSDSGMEEPEILFWRNDLAVVQALEFTYFTCWRMKIQQFHWGVETSWLGGAEGFKCAAHSRFWQHGTSSLRWQSPMVRKKLKRAEPYRRSVTTEDIGSALSKHSSSAQVRLRPTVAGSVSWWIACAHWFFNPLGLAKASLWRVLPHCLKLSTCMALRSKIEGD